MKIKLSTLSLARNGGTLLFSLYSNRQRARLAAESSPGYRGRAVEVIDAPGREPLYLVLWRERGST